MNGFRVALITLIFGLIYAGMASASTSGGTCSNFSGGSCPASIPSGVTSFYFIDYSSGSDANSGTSEATPWQHLPSCANATGIAASHTPGRGEGWILKGGVTVDYRCWPANLPWGGVSGAPNYVGPDPGWFVGGSWSRPIFSGGGSTGYNSNNSGLLNDAVHPASYVVIDNIEFTALWWSGQACKTNPSVCNYVTWHHGFSISGDTGGGWEIKNIYAHNITHTAYPTSFDPSNNSALFNMPRDSASSFHDNYIDNLDGGADCCWAVFTANIYRNYFSGLDNVIFNATSPNNPETVFLFHDNTIRNMVTTFYPNDGTEPHGNCIHIFGTQASSFNELLYNNNVDCTDVNAENFEVEEDAATVYYFNNLNTNTFQPNGYDTSSFSGSGKGGTYYFFQNTIECGVNPTPGYVCANLRNNPTVFHSNILGVTNSKAVGLTGTWTGTIAYAPDTSKTCGSSSTPHFGGTLVCAPIGSGNGTGNLNFNETYPYAPLDSTAATTVGTGTSQASLCSTIKTINAAAGTACLSDTTLGVNPNTSNHTVSWPARTPVPHPTSGNWQIGAYEVTGGSSQVNPPTGLAAVVN